MSLNQYQRKRNFNSTPEPKGKVAKKTNKPLRFVVHLHAATRPHFDLRLEMGGVYKSWAVPKGPSLNPAEQRLAIFVEDHPIEYGDFEGIIPKGNYGAGTVMIWDKGTYHERSQKDDQLIKNMEAGKITIIMQGEKLQGEFALIRIRHDDKTWLLVKKHDEHANISRNFVFDDHSVVTGRSMQEIKDAADAKWIRNVGRVAVKKGEVEKKSPSPGKVATSTKSTQPTKSVPTRAEKAAAVSSRVVTLNPGPWLFEDAWEGYRAKAEVDGSLVKLQSQNGIPFSEKFAPIVAALKKLKKKAVFEGTIVALDEQGQASRTTLNHYMSRGEGELRFMINDVLASEDMDWRGKPLQERKGELRRLLARATKPLAMARDEAGTEKSSLTKLGFSQAKVLARPLFGSYRECLSKSRLLPLTATTKTPVTAARHKDTKTTTATFAPKLSNLKKIYWPAEGYTKGDLLSYYDAIAEVILPHLHDRPLSLNRYPDGIQKPGFYQKDISGLVPRWLERQRLYSPSVDRTIDYAMCQNKESLLYLANLGCIEFHPWLSRAAHIENPDHCIIDLDPDGHAYADLVKTALAVRKVCDRVGIPLFPKTSGASGMHLCIPLGAQYSFDESRELAVAIAELVHEILPDLTSLKRNPGLRRGKIYLDCYQNRRGQTLAAPYCVRPLPMAPVSAPLRWSELKPSLSPTQFTMKNMRERLDKIGDIWLMPTSPGIDLKSCLAELAKKKSSRR